MTHQVVLVTGVASDWGAQVAARLVTEPGLRVLGLDMKPPEREIKGLTFVQADVRHPLVTELIKEEKVNTVCHLAFSPSIRPSEVTFNLNVIGTMKIFGACVAGGVHKIVLKSSTAVYGAHPQNPAFLSETHPLRGSRRYGYVRDRLEIESFCNDFRRQHPLVKLTILRFASIVGPTADTPMTHFLGEQWTPVLMGFDPVVQTIHQDDVVAALVHAVVHDVPGVFNVAAEGAMPLRRMMGLVGKLRLPLLHPLAYTGIDVLSRLGMPLARYAPMDLDYLRYRWVGDLTKMREELGFAPRYTAEETLREFVGQRRTQRYMPESPTSSYAQERRRGTVESRHQTQTWRASVPLEEEQRE